MVVGISGKQNQGEGDQEREIRGRGIRGRGIRQRGIRGRGIRGRGIGGRGIRGGEIRGWGSGGREGEEEEVMACLKSKSLCQHHHGGLQLEEKDIINNFTSKDVLAIATTDTNSSLKSNSVLVMAA